MGRGRLADRGTEHADRRRGEVPDRTQAEAAQLLGGAFTDAPQREDRQRMQEVEHPVGGHDRETVRLRPGRRELGDELGRRDTDRAGQPLLVPHPVADQLADLGRPAEQPARPETSRNASSTDSGSTNGVTSRKICMTTRDAAEYSLKSGGRKIAEGHKRRACAPGIALRTPNSRAS